MIFEERDVEVAVESTIMKEDFKAFVVTTIVKKITVSTTISVFTSVACASLKTALIDDSK
jgi:hypothetical protein